MARAVKMGCTLWVVTLVVLALITTGLTNAVIQCNDAIGRIFDCRPFVTGEATTPSAACCAGEKDLDRIAAASRTARRFARASSPPQSRCLSILRKAGSFPNFAILISALPSTQTSTAAISLDANFGSA
ncbi:LOW QUALITY PROTEIN: hypothetical protein RJ639_030932 [Escallonia herrerae]|uniref:Bifunctional inhibitor/plant lipid transfer protein/seed storage helical domain-containing protein n=1 Tax=Escallonia herrerae TaxID=1293975 RepID=A0AA88WZU3_9ASTE|nr:LOW QUALITY PROTEIN: hypothetical protein RJ639_030932 [Escallonia herrerae]